MEDWILTPQSSHVEAISWDEEGHITRDTGIHTSVLYPFGSLYVAYKTGTVYQYEGVSRSDYQAISRANSVGGALHRLCNKRRFTIIGSFDPDTKEMTRR